MTYTPTAIEPQPELIAQGAAGAALEAAQAVRTVAVVGLGYVGLPTGIALCSAGIDVVGIDVSERRLENIREGTADLLEDDRERLGVALAAERLRLTSEARTIAAADAVIVCVPTPVDADHRPDLRALASACNAVVANAREGQLLVLTSTSYVGTTRELLAGPLADRGLVPGRDVHVAFSPERIDPGNETWRQEAVPRVVGGMTPDCTRAAKGLIEKIAARVHPVSSPEAAELTKLYENSFRAVNIAFANELADISRGFGLDPIEVIEAAATKPYGFMAFHPGPGVGGHCIPSDPHYLLWGIRKAQAKAPVLECAMEGIAARPREVVARAVELLEERRTEIACARVLLIGMAYKPGIQDIRESPALEIIDELSWRGAEVSYHDPLVRSVSLQGGLALLSVAQPHASDFDLAIVLTSHPDHDYSWLEGFDQVLDCTYRTADPSRRALL